MLVANPRRLSATLAAALLTAAVFAGAVAAGPLGTPPPTPPAGAAPTALTLTGPKGSVRYGSKAALGARLTSAGKAVSGRIVKLYRGSDAAGWTAVAQARTDKKGKAAFKVEATATAGYAAAFQPAGTPDAPTLGPSESAPVTVNVKASLDLTIPRALQSKGHSFLVLPGTRVKLVGTTGTGNSGATVAVKVTRGSATVLEQEAPVDSGRFTVAFSPHKGTYRIEATTTGGEGVAPATVVRHLTVNLPRTHSGQRGKAVRLLQRSLKRLHYVTPVNGTYGPSTARAVLAFKKVNKMRRNGSATRAVWRKLAKGRGGFKLKYPRAGRHAEFDWSRQVLVLAAHGKPVRIYHVSSGKPSTPTVFGTFRFYSRQAGFNSHGMYYSTYFIRGYAIHGFAQVPTFAASHGCIRVPIPQAVSIYRWLRLGETISAYR